MRKKLSIILLVVFFYTSLQAQRNVYEDADTSLNKVEEVEPDTLISTKVYTDNEDAFISTSKNGFTKLGAKDTLFYFNDYTLNIDTLNAWKNAAKYAWIKNLDSLLKKEKATATNKKNSGEQEKDKRKKTTEGEESLDDSRSSNFSVAINSPILKTILWLIAICFVGFIVYQLFLSKGVFKKQSKKTKVVENEIIDEDNLANDFDSLYRRAYAAGDTRMAMRYLFLKTLQSLNEKEIIQFAPDKTNSQYAREIPAAKRNDFASLALYYEYIWYGNVAISKEMFTNIEIKFNQFLNKL